MYKWVLHFLVDYTFLNIQTGIEYAYLPSMSMCASA